MGASPIIVFNTKEASHWFPDVRVPKKFTPSLKNGISTQKRPNLAQIWPNIGLFGPFGPVPYQKTMRTRCVGGLLLCRCQNFCFLTNRIFGPKTAKFCPKYAFLVILGQILAFLIRLFPCQTSKTMRTRGFSDM